MTGDPLDCAVSWIVGVPKAGKTTLALSLAWREAERTGRPVLAVDSCDVRQLAGIPAARTLTDAVARLYSRAPLLQRCCAVVPKGMEDVEAVCRVALEGRDLTLIIDEAAFWLRSQTSPGSPILRLLRSVQHSRCSVYLTTQHLSGDVPQAALTCADRVILFRCTSPAVLDTVKRSWGVSPETVRRLPRGSYVDLQIGF